LPFIPHGDPGVLDSTGPLALNGLPKRLLVLRGGIIGLEMGTVYHSLGVKVTIVELMDQIIPGADIGYGRAADEADRQTLRKHPAENQGHSGRRRNRRTSRAFEGLDGTSNDLFDRLLVVVGRHPSGKMVGAEEAGVAVDERGFIAVDKQMRTNVPHISAIGDLVGQPILAHKAVH
jgi:dihydrolipoamide dehydrogenase